MSPPDDHDLVPQLMDYDDVATALKVSVRLVRRLVSEGELRAIKVAGAVRFDPADVRQFLLLNRTGLPPKPTKKQPERKPITGSNRTHWVPPKSYGGGGE